MTHTHDDHDHEHGKGCGHTAIKHQDHVDYVHDGHLHHQTESGEVEEHAIEVTAKNPNVCNHEEVHLGHDPEHTHGPDCGHGAIPHGDHVDYLVDGRLHHQHGDHCDDHGPVEVVQKA